MRGKVGCQARVEDERERVKGEGRDELVNMKWKSR